LLIIRQEQIKVFEESGWKLFEDELLDHFKVFAQKLFEMRGEQIFRQVIRLGIERAKSYGLTLRGPIRFYIELMFSLGCDFDSDPQLPWVSGILNAEKYAHEKARSDALYEATSDYFDRVFGPQNAYTVDALKSLCNSGIDALLFSTPDIEDSLLLTFNQYYPQKYTMVGERALLQIIREASSQARAFNVPTPQAQTVLAILMFVFGFGVACDPLYPWIGQTLSGSDEQFAEGSVRRLASKSNVYVQATLEHLS
jgi:hypothetical protein